MRSRLHHRQRPRVKRSQPRQRSSIIKNTAFLHHFASAIQRTKPVPPLSQILGPLILAYNATLEAVWQGTGLQDRQGEFQQALGASYEISQRLSIGVEMLHEFVFPEWRDNQRIRNFFIGPNISFRHRNWFVTVTALAQATDTVDEADFQMRTIFGIGF